MKLLILSCNTGEGHNSAAYAVAAAFRERQADVVLIDPIALKSEKLRGVVSDSYNDMIKKAPAAFGLLYKAGDLVSKTRMISPVFLANTLYAGKLRRYIQDHAFDAVICTHLFPMEALTALKRLKACPVPCFGVLTDYTCVPFFAETRLDGYFVPRGLFLELQEQGLPGETLIASGIPVHPKFSQPRSREEARKKLGLPQDPAILLIMSGGVGCGNILELCAAFLRQAGDDVLAYVLVGRNSLMQQQIEEAFGTEGRIRTVAFTPKVNLYMNAADVLISKPGGLSSTEAAVANIPLVHLLAFSGCESKNYAFFTGRGMSAGAPDAAFAIREALELIRNSEKAEAMRKAQRTNIPRNAAEQVVEEVLKRIEEWDEA